MQNASLISIRAHRVEFEHMVPAERFGRQFPCWQEATCERHVKGYKGRPCCSKIDSQFRRIEAELYNLWPAVGLVNQARSNYPYGLVSLDIGFYGCNFKLNKKERRAEPDDKAKGIVARANLFMSDYYNPFTPSEKQLFEKWNKAFPPEAWEKEWATRIAAIEGYENPYITGRG